MLLALFVFVLYTSMHERVISVGDTAPDFSITADNGRAITRANFGGKLLVLNFWATWCPPCVEEVPSLDQFAKQMAGSGVVVLGVSVDKDRKLYRAFLDREPRFVRDRARSGSQDQRRLRHVQVSRDLHHRLQGQGGAEDHRRDQLDRWQHGQRGQIVSVDSPVLWDANGMLPHAAK